MVIDLEEKGKANGQCLTELASSLIHLTLDSKGSRHVFFFQAIPLTHRSSSALYSSPTGSFTCVMGALVILKPKSVEVAHKPACSSFCPSSPCSHLGSFLFLVIFEVCLDWSRRCSISTVDFCASEQTHARNPCRLLNDARL